MGQISLDGMHFYAHHGYYTEERKRGNNYLIDVQMSYDMEDAGRSDDLAHALNYEVVYSVCQEEMAQPRHLIETVARNIATTIRNKFPDIEHVRVKVRKEKPELGGPVEYATVIYVI